MQSASATRPLQRATRVRDQRVLHARDMIDVQSFMRVSVVASAVVPEPLAELTEPMDRAATIWCEATRYFPASMRHRFPLIAASAIGRIAA